MIILVGGCAGLDSVMSTRGVIDSSISKFNGTEVINMTPAFTNGGLQVEFGLYWEYEYKDNARLIVDISGAQNFNREKNLDCY